MEYIEKTFTLKEVESLIKNAYEVGFCDGEDGGEFKEYEDADDFWDRNFKQWIVEQINYVV